ncbi:uncharacterized protein ACA1_322130 [Acanthamoeba castellanii str. Neff]|uniref:DNA-directed DNA polymerase family A palm domain-containing protein n=1 Tax=Acanthamoeba castellanii (strain ATCC 30010 / Neff) TaxID=1257118 RepID=L8GPT6_ACACF|nr:uncharacterized protein ACA1_322130 [Acanthamoeba castellanii str. Neff]ELR14116.1 hypothetical protein ACA1_322130 [Acanthamoeba castellanii str. Neff]
MAVDIDQARRIQRYYEKKLYDATAQLVENPDFEGMFHEDKKKAKFREGQGEPGAPPSGEHQTENGGEDDGDGDEAPAKLLENSERPMPKTAIRNTFSTATKTWLQYAEYHPFIRSWVEMDRASRHLAFLDHLRTPRKGGFREMFRASEGRLILSVDYDFIELCTLASVCEARYGYSNLAEVIRKGVDPHSFTASMFEGVELAQFMSWKDSADGELRTKFTTLRQRAKEYAKTAYNVELSYPEAVFFKKRLTKEVYPELHKYLREREFAVVAHNLQCTWEECIPALALKAPRVMSNAVKNLIRGRTLKLTERHKSDVEWQNKISKMIEASNNVGSDKLFSRIFGSSVTTLTGRVRGFVTFTQACNTPFSGLAADGAKLAMWNLYMVGYRIIGFIHDESHAHQILVEIDEDSDWTAEAQMVERIVCEAMQELNGTIPISCSFALSRFWSKSAEAVYDDKGRLTVWKA